MFCACLVKCNLQLFNYRTLEISIQHRRNDLLWLDSMPRIIWLPKAAWNSLKMRLMPEEGAFEEITSSGSHSLVVIFPMVWEGKKYWPKINTWLLSSSKKKKTKQKNKQKKKSFSESEIRLNIDSPVCTWFSNMTTCHRLGILWCSEGDPPSTAQVDYRLSSSICLFFSF